MNPVKLPIGQNATLIYIPTDRFKSEFLSVSFSLPLREMTAQQNIMTLALTRRGTASHPTLAALNRHLDEMYSTTVSHIHRRLGDCQVLGLKADFLAARYVGGGTGLLPAVIDVLADRLLFPAVDEKGLYREQDVRGEVQDLVDGIRSEINSPRSYATARCRRLLCEGEPYALSLIGTETEAETLTASGLFARHRALVDEISPVFCYVGSQPPETVSSLLLARFGHLTGKGTPFQSAVHRGKTGVLTEQEEMPIMQGKLSLGFRTDVNLTHPLAPAMLYLDEIYGGSAASKLFLNVREARSLCYYCSSSLDLYKGVMFADCGMKVEHRAIAEEAMLAEFDAIAAGEISDAEFAAARRSIEHAYRQMGDNPAGLSRFYTARAMAGVQEDMTAWRHRLSCVTKEEIVAAAAHVAHKASFFLKGTRDGEGEYEE